MDMRPAVGHRPWPSMSYSAKVTLEQGLAPRNISANQNNTMFLKTILAAKSNDLGRPPPPLGLYSPLRARCTTPHTCLRHFGHWTWRQRGAAEKYRLYCFRNTPVLLSYFTLLSSSPHTAWSWPWINRHYQLSHGFNALALNYKSINESNMCANEPAHSLKNVKLPGNHSYFSLLYRIHTLRGKI